MSFGSDDPHLYPYSRFRDLGFSPEDVRYEITTPEALAEAGRFDEIQDLRFRYYEQAFRIPSYDFARFRPPEQVRQFVGKLSIETFSDPQLAVGATARAYQKRINPKIAVAFEDKTDKILGFTHGAENVSSNAQRAANKVHLAGLGKVAGGVERSVKHLLDHYFIWASEAVHDPELPVLASVTTEQFLAQYNSLVRGSWWPYADEWGLEENLRAWGYVKDPETIEDVNVEEEFGPGAAPTTYSMWKSLGTGISQNSIVHAEPVVAKEVKRAHEMLQQNS